MSVESSVGRPTFFDRVQEIATTLRQNSAARKIQRIAADLQADGIPLYLENFGWTEESEFGDFLSINPYAVRGVARTAKDAGLIDEKGYDYLLGQADELIQLKAST